MGWEGSIRGSLYGSRNPHGYALLPAANCIMERHVDNWVGGGAASHGGQDVACVTLHHVAAPARSPRARARAASPSAHGDGITYICID